MNFNVLGDPVAFDIGYGNVAILMQGRGYFTHRCINMNLANFDFPLIPQGFH